MIRIDIQDEPAKVFDVRKLLRLLRSLGTELHEPEHTGVGADDEDHDDAGVSPTVVVMVEVHRAKVILSTTVHAHTAAFGRVGVN